MDPSELVADLPADLTRIILKAMAREPADRYATAEMMGNDLQKLVHQEYARTRHEDKQSIDLTLQFIFDQPGGEAVVPRVHSGKDKDRDRDKDDLTRPMSIPVVEAVSRLDSDDPTAVGGAAEPAAPGPVAAPFGPVTPAETELAMAVSCAEVGLGRGATRAPFEQPSDRTALEILASASDTQELPVVPPGRSAARQ
jgi:hypothetical protein